MGCNLVIQVAFKKCAPFTMRIKKINGTALDNTGNLNLVIPMYNLMQCGLNYSYTAGSL